MHSDVTSRRVEALTEINLDDLVASFGWEGRRLLARALRRLCLATAREFARQMLAYDDAVGRSDSLDEASRAMLQQHYVRELRVEGLVHRPVAGPALFLANHPGLTDTMSLIAAIGRADLKIIAVQRPFLESLPHIAAHILFVDANLGRRVIAAHDAADHLRRGGAVLTFPAGRIEPDPDVHPDAADSIDHWADSARVLARMVPETKVVPVLVRGVVCNKTARHWLTRLKRNVAERNKLSAALQLLAMVSRGTRPTAVTIRFAGAVCATLADGPGSDLHPQVLERMRQMIGEATPAVYRPKALRPQVA